MFEKLRRTPSPPSRTRIATSSSSPEEMTMSSSVRLASRSSSVIARARGDRSTPRRARASAVSPSPSIDRSQNVESARRRRERREFGGVSFSFLIFSFLDDDEKGRARRGDVIVVALDARACIFFETSPTTRVKARRDARDALEGDIHSVLSRGDVVVGCAVLVRAHRNESEHRACVRRKTFPSRRRRVFRHRPCHKPRVVAVIR